MEIESRASGAMIEFATLFLGLVAGPQVVELTAAAEVAEIRILVDRKEVAVDTEPPWRAEFDLGSALKPHLLEAVAFDAAGNELGRSAQRLNLPRPPAEARLVLERDTEGTVVAVRATWESRTVLRPREARAWLDGEPLEVSDPERIAIPAHDGSGFHFLQVELEFTLDVIAQAQAVFGGLYLDEARADLTALPVSTRGRAPNSSPAGMSTWFKASGRTLRVSAFDKGGLDLVLVRGPGVGAAVRALEGSVGQGLSSGGSGTPGVAGVGSLGSISNMASASAADRLRRVMAFERGQRLRIMTPGARAQHGRTVAMSGFAMSPEITNEHGGMYWALPRRRAG